MQRRRCATRARRTIFWPRKSRNAPTAIPASPISPCRTRKAAADELERCVRDLKFCGAMINGHTQRQISRRPLLRSVLGTRGGAQARRSICIRPIRWRRLPALAGYNVLARPMWGWGVETGSHALRLICGGVFHRYPKAKLVLGHLGETLPFQLWRFDSRSKPYGWNLPKPPSQYLKENVWVTMSGMYDLPPVQLLARRARARPRHVLVRLSVRLGGRRRIHGRRRRWTNPCAPMWPTTTRRNCWGCDQCRLFPLPCKACQRRRAV